LVLRIAGKWQSQGENRQGPLWQVYSPDNLYLVGHWVFPGFGVPGMMTSGYYVAKEILEAGATEVSGNLTVVATFL